MRIKLIGLVIMAATLGAVVPVIKGVASALDAATADQCRTNSWPKEAHDIHIDWCVDNGYAIK